MNSESNNNRRERPALRVVQHHNKQHSTKLRKLFGAVASFTAQAAGRPVTFILASLTIIVWGLTGPYFNFSDTWQLVINTGTTIVTFLMVFLIQNSQNRDGAAIQVKLDELIRVSAAHNTFVGIEHLTDEELNEIREKCERRAKSDSRASVATLRINKKAAQAAEDATS